jgi:hypothetical protein
MAGDLKFYDAVLDTIGCAGLGFTRILHRNAGFGHSEVSL